LLVVCAIIGVLAALLVSSFSRARETARSVQCINNLKQAALSVQLYVKDNGYYMPPFLYSIPDPGSSGQFSVMFKKPWSLDDVGPGALKAALLCPSDKKPVKIPTTDFQNKPITNSISYAYNYSIQILGENTVNTMLAKTVLLWDGNPAAATNNVWYGAPSCDPDPITGKVTMCQVNPGNPHTIIINRNAVPAHLSSGDYCGPCGAPGASTNALVLNQVSTTLVIRHFNKSNIIFLDGHAEQLTALPSDSLYVP